MTKTIDATAGRRRSISSTRQRTAGALDISRPLTRRAVAATANESVTFSARNQVNASVAP